MTVKQKPKKQALYVQFVPDKDVKKLLEEARSRGYTTKYLMNVAARNLLINNMPKPLAPIPS